MEINLQGNWGGQVGCHWDPFWGPGMLTHPIPSPASVQECWLLVKQGSLSVVMASANESHLAQGHEPPSDDHFYQLAHVGVQSLGNAAGPGLPEDGWRLPSNHIAAYFSLCPSIPLLPHRCCSQDVPICSCKCISESAPREQDLWQPLHSMTQEAAFPPPPHLYVFSLLPWGTCLRRWGLGCSLGQISHDWGTPGLGPLRPRLSGLSLSLCGTSGMSPHFCLRQFFFICKTKRSSDWSRGLTGMPTSRPTPQACVLDRWGVWGKVGCCSFQAGCFT